MAIDKIIINTDICVNQDVLLYHFGEETCDPSHRFGPFVRDHYLIHYILSGNGIFVRKGITYHLSEHMCFLIEPNEVTYYEADSVNPWHYVWIGFKGNLAAEYLRLCGFNDESPTLTVALHAEMDIGTHVNHMLKNRSAQDSSIIWQTGQLLVLISHLIKNHEFSQKGIRTKSQTEIYVNRALQFIHNNYSHDITIQIVADYIGLDRSYFYTIFKKQLGISPKEYLIGIRVKKAKELLTTTTLTLTEIAFSTGYVDPFLFSKTIKKHTGLSPREYRKDILEPKDHTLQSIDKKDSLSIESQSLYKR